jgi:hypothetical protein
MTDSAPNLPAPIQTPLIRSEDASSMHVYISEFAAVHAGSMSPFGDDLEFPVPLDHLSYRHPGPADRPHLAGD